MRAFTRRGFASSTKLLCTSSKLPRLYHSPWIRESRHVARNPILQPLARDLHAGLCRRQHASTAVDVEPAEEEEEEDIDVLPGDVVDPSQQGGLITSFRQLSDHGMVCDTLVDTLTKDMGLVTMTPVQSRAIAEALKGVDVWVASLRPQSIQA
jgi:hypothetical protein